MVIDASVWVSSFVPEDVHHGISRGWLDRELEQGSPLTVPTIVFPEIGGALARRTGSPELGIRSAELIRAYPNLLIVALDIGLSEISAELAARNRLRGADAVYVAVAFRLKLPLITWDAELLARASSVIPVHTPS